MINETVMVDAHFVVGVVIDFLDNLECDGETMEHIIRKVGLEDQMLRQLIMTMPLEQIEHLIEERTGLALQN